MLTPFLYDLPTVVLRKVRKAVDLEVVERAYLRIDSKAYLYS